MLSGRVMSVNAVHSSNTHMPIPVTLSGMEMPVKAVQLWKASISISVTPSGMVIFFTFAQPLKDSCPMAVTLCPPIREGITTSFDVPTYLMIFTSFPPDSICKPSSAHAETRAATARAVRRNVFFIMVFLLFSGILDAGTSGLISRP